LLRSIGSQAYNVRAEKRGYYWFTRQLTKLDGMSLPKPSAAKKTALMIFCMPSGMREPWLMRTWASTNVPTPNLKSPARGRRVYAEAPDYEHVAARLGL